MGVWAVRALAEAYHLPPDVRLVDTGVMTLSLLPEIKDAQHLLIIDALEGKGTPGTLYHLTVEDLPDRQGPTLSVHQIGIGEILAMIGLLGTLPHTRILGVQPLETTASGLGLTLPLQKALTSVVEAIVEELRTLGVKVTKRSHPRQSPTQMA